LKLNCFDLVLK